MKRSRLKNKANKTKSCNDIISYKKQTVKLNKKSKFEYFNKYDPNRQAKPFWVNCKAYFSNKHSKADTNMLSENGKLIMKNQDIANIFNPLVPSVH